MPPRLSRPYRRRPQTSSIVSLPRLLGGALLGVAIVEVARTVARARRVPLRSEWTAIPGIRRATSLSMHARVSDDVPTSLPPVVLVHGYGMGSSYFVPLAARLHADAHVYAPDLPGHGPSDHDVRPLKTCELADALAAWMGANGLRGAVLVGHSFGTQVAAEVAATRPDLVSGLVLIAPVADPMARSALGQIVRAVRCIVFERPTLAVWGTLEFSRSGVRVLAAELEQLITYRIEDALPRLAIPTRVVRGERDQLVPQAWAETVARLVNAPAPTVIGRWSHAVHYDDPNAVADVVLELAAEVAKVRVRA
jgi:pimeloyl-ACP methyl ester carboxylesterase